MKKIYFKHIIILFILCSSLNLPTFSETCLPKDISLLKQQGIVFYNEGKYEDALDKFLKIPYSSRDEEVFLLVANSYESTGKNSYAIDTLSRLINFSPKNFKAYYNLGSILLKSERCKEAIGLFDITIKLKEDFHPAYYNKGICLFSQEDYKNAKKSFEKAIKLDEKNSNYFYNLALVYKKLKKDKKAQKYYEKYKNLK